MKSLKDLLQQSKQKTYMLGQAFAEGTWVENNNGEVGKNVEPILNIASPPIQV